MIAMLLIGSGYSSYAQERCHNRLIVNSEPQNALVGSLWLFSAAACDPFGTSSPLITGLLGRASQLTLPSGRESRDSGAPAGYCRSCAGRKDVRTIPRRLVVPVLLDLFLRWRSG
jgi:hypothetical protein